MLKFKIKSESNWNINNLIPIIFFIILNKVSHTLEINNNYNKCCAFNEKIVLNNATSYECAKDNEKRIQLNPYKVLNNSSDDDQCIDVHKTGIYLFNKTKSIQLLKPLETNLYPKCCPLQSYYDENTHSCTNFSSNETEKTNLEQQFLQIGLPHCNIISDRKINNKSDVILEDDFTLYLQSTGEKFNNRDYCYDINAKGDGYLRVCEDGTQICDRTTCFHKCCPDGQSFINGSVCKDSYVHGLALDFSPNINYDGGPFAIIHGYNCRLYVVTEKRYNFSLQQDGSFSLYTSKTNTTTVSDATQNSYCIEHVLKKATNMYKFYFFQCLIADVKIATKFLITRWAMILSCIFLFATIVLYFISGEIGNVFGKAIVSYCFSMLMGFSLTSYLVFDLYTKNVVCTTVGFLAYFFLIAQFTWINTMCLDIYFTFGSPKSFTGVQQKRKNLKKFLKYSLYSWGVPLILVLIPGSLYAFNVLPSWLEIKLDGKDCLINKKRSGSYADKVFTALPLTILEVSNLILFIRTVYYCLKVKNEINKMNDNQRDKGEATNKFNKYKERFGLIFKLSIIMGISFLFEVVSTFFDFKKTIVGTYIEIIWDTFNCLQGVLIFVIFICKRKFLKKVKEKLKIDKGRRSSSYSCTTQLTIDRIHSHNSKDKYYN